MATTMPSDLKVYDPRARGGFTERLLQNLNVFNAASGGTIRLQSRRIVGNFEYNSLFKMAGSLVSRRDETAMGAVAAKKLVQDESIGVKVNRKIGPLEWTDAAFKKAGYDESTFRFVAGQEAADAQMADQITTALTALTGRLVATPALLHEAKPASTYLKPTTPDLVDAIGKMGDKADNVVAFVMHSSSFFDLVKDQIAMKVTGITNLRVTDATPATLGRPVLVTDDPALIWDNAGTPARYILGLTRDSIVIEDSEEETIIFDRITGLENLATRMQGEFAYNLTMKAHKWDVTNGGANPALAAIGTATNWDAYITDPKAAPGVIIKCA